MRPRGESISTPSSRYVGQAFRHKPQWTQRSRSACCGASTLAAASDAAIESSRIQQMTRVEQVLHPLHDLKVRAKDIVAGRLAVFEDIFPAAAVGQFAPRARGFPIGEVRVADSRAGAGNDGSGGLRRQCAHLGQRARNAGDARIAMRRNEFRGELSNARPQSRVAFENCGTLELALIPCKDSIAAARLNQQRVSL